MALILMVEEESLQRHGANKALANEGYRLISITDPAATWAYISRFKPDLVLLNGLSEGFESYDLLNDIKQRAPELPVLVYMVKTHDDIKKLKQAVALALFEVQFSRREKQPRPGGARRSDRVQTGL